VTAVFNVAAGTPISSARFGMKNARSTSDWFASRSASAARSLSCFLSRLRPRMCHRHLSLRTKETLKLYSWMVGRLASLGHCLDRRSANVVSGLQNKPSLVTGEGASLRSVTASSPSRSAGWWTLGVRRRGAFRRFTCGSAMICAGVGLHVAVMPRRLFRLRRLAHGDVRIPIERLRS
jgi:hypothetical protein